MVCMLALAKKCIDDFSNVYSPQLQPVENGHDCFIDKDECEKNHSIAKVAGGNAIEIEIKLEKCKESESG